jgi:hypothetical protein
VLTLRGVRRTAPVLLLFLQIDQPVKGYQVAAILDIDQKTARQHLLSLVELGFLIQHADRDEFELSPAGREIFLPKGEEISPSGLHAACQHKQNKKQAAASKQSKGKIPVCEAKKRGLRRRKSATDNRSPPQTHSEVDLDQMQRNLAALRAEGLRENPRVLAVSELDHITESYIHRQASRLRQEGRFTTSLLLHILESGDPLPEVTDPNDPNRYVSGELAELIQH